MWNFCFPVAPRSVNKLDSRCSSAPLFTAPMSGRAEARPEISRRWHQPTRAADCQHVAREAVCPTTLIERLTAEKCPRTEQRQSIKVCQPMPFQPQSHAGPPSRHVWAKTVFTHGGLNRERGANWKSKKRGPAYQRLTQQRRLISYVHRSIFFFRKISTCGMC